MPSCRRRSVWWDIWGGKVSGLILIAALAAELITQVKTNSISGQVIAVISDKAAEARERADKLELDLARLTSPRKIENEDAFLTALNGGPKPVWLRVLYLKDDAESQSFALTLLILFMQAKWPVEVPPMAPITQSFAIYPPMWDLVPSTLAVGAQPHGISLVANKIDETKGTPLLDTLQKALLDALGGRPVYRGLNATLPDGALLVVVAPKE